MLINGSEVTGSAGEPALGDRITSGSYSVSVTDDGVTELASGLTFTPIENYGFPFGGTLVMQTQGEALEVLSTGTGAFSIFGWGEVIGGPGGVAYVAANQTGNQEVQIVAGSYTTTLQTWTFGQDGSITLPEDNPIIKGGGTGTDVTVIATTGSNTATWTFSAGGNISLPNGSSIDAGDYNQGIGLTTNRGTIRFGNTPELIGGPSHFHIMRDGLANVDLFFGDDYNYVLQPSNGGVVIGSNGRNGTGTQQTWTFGEDGALTFPDSTTQTTAYSSTYTGWFQPAETVVQLDTLLARINSTGTMQISTTIVETEPTGAAFAWNGVRNQGATMSSFGQGGTNWVLPGNWLDISPTPLDNNFEVATVSVFKLGGTGSLYRITYVGATNSQWSVVIERVAKGTA